MSRMTIRRFLEKTKKSLYERSPNKSECARASFVIGNESADLDSITSALVYGYIKSSGIQAHALGSNSYIIPVTNIPAKELRLRPELTALLKHANLKPTDLIVLDHVSNISDTLQPEYTDWTLVDHNKFQGTLGRAYSKRVIRVIDHHEDEGVAYEYTEPKIIEKAGSCSSLVTNEVSAVWDNITTPESTVQDAQVAKLALGSILIDTVNLQDQHKVTEHDRTAVKYLEAKISASDREFDRNAFFKEINDAKSNLDDLSLEDILRKDYKEWNEGDLTLGISSVVQPISYLESKVSDLVSALLGFATSRELQLYAVMTAHSSSGGFERQLLLMAIEGGKAVEVAEKFVQANGKELQLNDISTKVLESSNSRAEWLRLWDQKNVDASRKVVAPMLRGCLK